MNYYALRDYGNPPSDTASSASAIISAIDALSRAYPADESEYSHGYADALSAVRRIAVAVNIDSEEADCAVKREVHTVSKRH